LDWEELPELPASLGVAGPFVGISNDALIVAGGANFPEPVWETSKTWYDDIYVLVKDPPDGEAYRWIESGKLDRPIAYGATVSTSRGVVCMGGNDSAQTYSDVFVLQWDAEQETITQTALPSLPAPTTNAGAAVIGDTIYVAGGMTGMGLETAQSSFWSLDLSAEIPEWKSLPTWPGPSRALAITATQHNGVGDCIYVMSGRRLDNSTGEVQFLSDVYEFSPGRYDAGLYDAATGSYRGKKNPWRKRSDAPRSVMAGTGIAVGQSHVFVLGGADGSLFATADDLKDDHPGFPKEALSYHTITDTWISAGAMPANHVTTSIVRWGNDTVTDPIIIASGEVRPRVRSPKVWQILPVKRNETFGIIDFSVIVAYLGAMIGVGVFFSFRNKNADDFFRGGQRVPWFVAGLSIFATMLSSITFVALPAKAFATDWVYFILNMMGIAITPVIILCFLPFFRNIDATSAYEYLEKRFNKVTRLFASGSFVFLQIGRMAVVMYLPALALSAITPLSDWQCVLMMGILSIIYCTMGGLEAVVWTDTIQSFVLLGGALFSLVYILTQIDGGASGFMATASEHNKFHIVDWDFAATSFTTTALWVIVLGGLMQNLVSYSSDMAVVQRYMSVPDTGRAKRAIWTGALAILPASLLFFGVGTALFVFYAGSPDKLDPTFKTDAIFPLFIARELPMGIAGLVVAGIFAAAQSTVSTSMNSTSTALVTDFIRPLQWVRTERGYLSLGRVLTATMGIVGTLLALSFTTWDIKSTWDQFVAILGLFGGPMCGLFCLGIFTTRANGKGAIIGAVTGAAVLFFVQKYTSAHVLLYVVVGVSVCFITGYLASLIISLFSRSEKPIEGLTIYTLERTSS
jgi:SSS family transporter